MEGKKQTIVTSNLSIEELQWDKGYPKAIISRLMGFNQISWEVADWRAKLAMLRKAQRDYQRQFSLEAETGAEVYAR